MYDMWSCNAHDNSQSLCHPDGPGLMSNGGGVVSCISFLQALLQGHYHYLQEGTGHRGQVLVMGRWTRMERQGSVSVEFYFFPYDPPSSGLATYLS